MKKLAVVVCGWHYPNYFYKQLPSQDIPDDWEVDYFCISHRDPKYAIGEKDLNNGSDNLLELLDCFYYKDYATVESIESYGWKYIEKPNTLGDWGVYNQWVEDYDYKDYNMFLLSGDDNFIVRDDLLDKVLGNINVEHRTVDVHIRRLRKNININGTKDLIRTVRSSGYSLDIIK